MLPAEHITSEGFVYELLFQEQRKDASAEKLSHVIKAGKWNIEKSTFRIEPTLQHDSVEVWVPSKDPQTFGVRRLMQCVTLYLQLPCRTLK